MWKVVLYSPKFMPETEFTIPLETKPTEEEAELARMKFMAKRYEIIEVRD